MRDMTLIGVREMQQVLCSLIGPRIKIQIFERGSRVENPGPRGVDVYDILMAVSVSKTAPP